MARVCEITGKKPLSGNNVSHAMNKTKRRQLPNLQTKSMMSSLLGKMVSLRLCTTAIRTVDKHGGIDNFMLNYKNTDAFSSAALKLRKLIRSKATTSTEGAAESK